MKRTIRLLALVVCICILSVSLFGCSKGKEEESVVAEKTYYLTGSFNGYNVADEAYVMKKVSEESMLVQSMPDADLYYFTVNAENLTPDAVYGQHYYKVTAGNWEEAWGTEVYDLQPAAVYYDADGNPTGLGSIYIPGDYIGELTVVFDAVTKKIYDNTMSKSFEPRIYGDISTSFGMLKDWDYSEEGSFAMTKNVAGIYEADLELPAFTGTAETGATLYVVLSSKCYMAVGSEYDYISWGALEQYLISGTGAPDVIRPESSATYHITFNPVTQEVKVTKN
ncbi:MAG: hypothetical protein WCY62_03770 [Clostridia bacterium]